MNVKSPVFVTVLGLALAGGLAIAATTAPATPAAPTPPAAPAVPGDAIKARLAEKLGLTPEQQKAFEDLRAKHRAEMMALLTPEQQKKAAEMREMFGEKMHRMAAEHRPFGPRGGGFGRDSFGPGAMEHHGRRGPEFQPQPPENPMRIIAEADRIKDRIAEQLQLTDEQRDQLEHLDRAFRAQQRDAAKKHRDEMRAVLTPEQQKKADELKKKFERRPVHPPRMGFNAAPDQDDDGPGAPPPPEDS
ncbi:MAG TPA: hypothetical protein VG936_18280 [Lacunisphaera sp.]|nr:hypothetical protein [Lacunisphaera sp.]